MIDLQARALIALDVIRLFFVFTRLSRLLAANVSARRLPFPSSPPTAHPRRPDPRSPTLISHPARSAASLSPRPFSPASFAVPRQRLSELLMILAQVVLARVHTLYRETQRRTNAPTSNPVNYCSDLVILTLSSTA